MDWRDLRIALALEKHRSHLEAARALAVDATTVGRRIAALEAALGVPLFTHTPDGWRPTVAGARVLERAARMAEEARAIQRETGLSEERVAGTVRLTTLDEVATWLLVPRLHALRQRYPELVLDLRCTDHILDLVAGHADVAVRLVRPSEPAVRVRRLGTVDIGIYTTSARAAELTHPDAVPDLVVLGTTERPLPEVRWLLQVYPRGRVALQTNSVPAAFEAIRCGVGVGTMPTVLAASTPLVRLDDGRGAVERPVWRVVSEMVADRPAVRAVCQWLDELGTELIGA